MPAAVVPKPTPASKRKQQKKERIKNNGKNTSQYISGVYKGNLFRNENSRVSQKSCLIPGECTWYFLRENALMGRFEASDEELAEKAYDRYCEGNGETEGGCIDWAYYSWLESIRED